MSVRTDTHDKVLPYKSKPYVFGKPYVSRGHTLRQALDDFKHHLHNHNVFVFSKHYKNGGRYHNCSSSFLLARQLNYVKRGKG